MRYIQLYEINVRVWEFVIKKIALITITILNYVTRLLQP